MKAFDSKMKIVLDVAKALEDPETILTPEGISGHAACDVLSLSHGLPGICMLYGKLMESLPYEAQYWSESGKRYLGMIVNKINQTGISDMSMYSGLSGVGLSAVCMSNGMRDYKNLIATVNRTICAWVEKASTMVDFQHGTYAVIYDVIAGMSGVLSYLSIFKSDNDCFKALCKGIDMLIHLTEDIRIFDRLVPGWYVPAANQFTETESRFYSKGNFNTGLSHGIAGPLALLSQTAMDGIVRPGQTEAISKVIDFLMRYQSRFNNRAVWNSQLDFDQIVNGSVIFQQDSYRDAWCYGAPGICYALLCAATSIDDRELSAFCIDTLRDAAKSPEGLFSPTICHGYMGVLQLLEGAEDLLGKSCFGAEKQELMQKVLDSYDDGHKFKFKCIEYDHEVCANVAFDICGFLEGSAGIALGLCSLEHRKNNIWKKAILVV